ncbi:MAG TPA: porin [Caulobacterales bacterium]|nr:porin [Caulobacterales bacterium]
MKTKDFIGTAALAALTTAAGFAIATPASADVTTRWNGATETREEDRRFHVSGRFMYDVAYTDADCANAGCTGANEAGIRSYARRAFIGVDGRLTEHWRYNAKFDFGFGSAGSIKADDFYLEYAGDAGSLFFGNGNWVSPMEDRDSSLNIPFNERSFLITALGFGKKPGVGYLTNGGNWSAGVAVQSPDGLDTGDTASNGSEPFFVIGRGTWAPIYQQTPEGTMFLHLGLDLRYRNNGNGSGNALNGTFSYSPGALSNKSSNNAGVGAAAGDTYYGAEFAFQWNSLGFDGEYGKAQTRDYVGNATQLGDADLTGWYVDVFWSPTGESRRYNAADGSFGGVSPARTLGSDGGIGHIMLSGRIEELDLSDANFGANANESKAWTVGATWVPISHVKFQLNYSQTDVDYTVNNAAHVDNTIDAVTLRTQFDW